jgi:uncharacterized protein YndB with AHSA1/START domain
LSRNRTFVEASPATVFAVLCDPRKYSYFVVGTRKIRRFDPGYPEQGAAFHHTLGVGPVVLRDLSRVEEVGEEQQLVLRAQMSVLGVNRVAFELKARDGGTEVEVEEHPLEGFVARTWNPVFEAMLSLRNQEMLRRLRRAAEELQSRRSAETAP